ncbi:reverse transcriptase domain-containing protein [Tanacetum coccineum]
MSIRLADRSFQYPIGIAENMLVEVGKFTFPVDFVILKMKEDSKVLLILGRPFLHTADAIIHVKQKQLNRGVGSKRMVFSIDYALKHAYLNDDKCFSIDVIDEILEEDFDALLDGGGKILYSIEGTPLEDKIFVEFDEFIAMNEMEKRYIGVIDEILEEDFDALSIEGTLLEDQIFAEFDEFMAMNIEENSKSDNEEIPYEKNHLRY